DRAQVPGIGRRSGQPSAPPSKIARSLQVATRRMLVEPGVLKGTPAVRTIWSASVANPSSRAARAAETTAILNRLTFSVTMQWSPQESARRRAILGNGVSARIGTRGRSREARSAVVPVWVKQQIALIWAVSAISRAATVIASETPLPGGVRAASIIGR